MTTMASGLLDLGTRTGGKQQRDQAEGGDAGGHHHRPQPALGAFDDDSARAMPCAQLVEIGHHHHAVQHRDPQQGDEADRRRHRQVFAGNPQAEDAADQGERNIGNTSSAWRTEPKVENSRKKISASAIGTTTTGVPRHAAGSRTGRPRRGGSLGQLTRGDRGLGFLDEADQVAVAHVGLDHHDSAGAFSRSTLTGPSTRSSLATPTAARFAAGQRADAARRTGPGNAQLALPRMMSGVRRPCSITMPTLAFDLAAQGVLDVIHVEPEAAGGQAVDLHVAGTARPRS